MIPRKSFTYEKDLPMRPTWRTSRKDATDGLRAAMDGHERTRADTSGHRWIYADEYTNGHRRTQTETDGHRRDIIYVLDRHRRAQTGTGGHRRTQTARTDTGGDRRDMGGHGWGPAQQRLKYNGIFTDDMVIVERLPDTEFDIKMDVLRIVFLTGIATHDTEQNGDGVPH